MKHLELPALHSRRYVPVAKCGSNRRPRGLSSGADTCGEGADAKLIDDLSEQMPMEFQR